MPLFTGLCDAELMNSCSNSKNKEEEEVGVRRWKRQRKKSRGGVGRRGGEGRVETEEERR